MWDNVAIIISLLALLLTLYQAHQQRTYNKKAFASLGQVELGDFKGKIYIYFQNNGIGPLTIYKLTFTKDGKEYSDIKDCLDLDPTSYMHISVSESVTKSVMPGQNFIVFEKNSEHDTEIDNIRMKLAPITMTVHYKDLYDDKFTIERNLKWFARHMNHEKN